MEGALVSLLCFPARTSSSLTLLVRSFNGGQRLCLGQNLALYEATMGALLTFASSPAPNSPLRTQS